MSCTALSLTKGARLTPGTTWDGCAKAQVSTSGADTLLDSLNRGYAIAIAIAWCTARCSGSHLWWKYDDEKVTEVSQEEIMLLKGGGDRDMAYIAFFRAKSPSI